jgi:signal transduction histidine kinase
VLLVRLDERIAENQDQEYEELAILAEGTDPQTGRPFADLESLFDTFLGRNIPDRFEQYVAFDGSWVRPSIQVTDRPVLATVPQVASLVAEVTEPVRGTLVLEDLGELSYLAVPVEFEGQPPGAFAVVSLRSPQVQQVDEVVRILAGVIAGTVALASSVLWSVAGRILAPVRAVTETARAITETDLGERIAVEGDDEVSDLARTFNDMLDRLQAAFRSQREFIDDAGHELRTPITIIRGHLELMGDDPADREETTAIVLDELDRMNRFVDDLLVLATAGRPDFLDLATVDVAALTEELLAKARGLGDRRWELEAVGRGLLVADRQRVTQAVVQLAANAFQHTNPGTEIALGSAVSDGAVRFWVRDTGPGIAPEEQSRIFKRFARATSGERRSEGAGLGLSIVRAIARAHGGDAELRSRPGAGATFTVILPLEGREDTEEAR